ncbi:MAG: cache domain-containing protein [Sulfurovaceae bacterium]|nr:cache domain-containing protein [Sulfurovaceae bacterium]
MKKIIPILLASMLVSLAWAKKSTYSPSNDNSKATLNIAANYLESVFTNTLDSLELIASTPEAKSGDWNGIRRYLSQLASDDPGVYFFVLPNGNYYTLTQDYTNLNLSDRPYFKSLFAGNPVLGFTMYSRSTDKKSALVAVPVISGNITVGALGASIFLDDLHAKLNKEFDLPKNYLWFVIDSKGDDVLDKDKDFIFMNTLTQGSKSLHDEVTKALKNKSGVMQYEINGITRYAKYQKLPNMNWWIVLAKTDSMQIKTPMPMKLSLEHFVPNLQNSLDKIDSSLARSIETSRPNIKNESEIRKFLSLVLNENPVVVEAGFVDKKGILRYIEPGDYKNFEKSDISNQEHVISMRKNPRAVFSKGFKAVEGFLSVDLARPLYDDKNNFAGSVSELISPELLIEPILKKSTIPPGYELLIMQPDGMIIYDQDKEEIGRNLFSDSMYAEYESLLDLGKKIASTPTGKGSYIFIESKDKVIKNAMWQTVRLHDQEWRVILIHRAYD